MTRHRLALLVAALTSIVAQAQEPAVDKRLSRHSVEISWFGHQLTHPGLQGGYTYRLLQTESGRNALAVGADLGLYWWPNHSVGTFVLPRIGWRGRLAGGFQGEVNLHLGYVQGLLAGVAYRVDAAGNVSRSLSTGFPYLLVGPTAGVGWAFARGLTPFLRLGALWQTPVFGNALVRLVFMAGVEVRL
jgi:hypothetical protein